MDLEEQLRASLAAPDPGTQFTDAVMARVARAGRRPGGISASGGARRRSRWLTRFIFVGIMAAAGVAAAMLAERLARVPEPPMPAPVSAPGPGVVVTPDATSAPDTRITAGVRPDKPGRIAAPAAPSPASVPAPPPQPVDVPVRFTILLLPLNQQAQDATDKALAETYYAAMIEEFRKVPQLRLLLQNEAAASPGHAADYVVAMTSRDTRDSGVVQILGDIRSAQPQGGYSEATRDLVTDRAPHYSASEKAAEFVQSLLQGPFPLR
ncbi:MAG TPA: hypothetical protein VMH77_06620 [Steroidobacteraceae bacterium]|nr:hypothetical protein [Steroidobacteraceae bacterium]